MDMNLNPEDEAFRQEVRGFVAETLPEDIRDKVRDGRGYGKDEIQRWNDIMNAKGWVAPAWPVEHGGTGWSTMQFYIFDEEMENGFAPGLNSFGTHLVGPVIIAYGSKEQKAHYLPRILSAEDWWCQGYSEPNAGSDLASLSCRAIQDGDDYIINGSKMWTTWAQYADWIFCLVRTSTEGKRQAGISFLLVDINTPGITIRPVITIDGDHEVNQVFFEDVRVPVVNRIGEENKGWTYAKFLLSHERFMSAEVPRSKRMLAKLKQVAATEQSGDRPLIENPRFRERMAKTEIELMALEYTALRYISAANADEEPGTEVSLLKLRGSEVQQDITELLFEAVGHYAFPYFQPGMEGRNEPPIGPDYAPPLAAQYFNNRKTSIYAGSNEIQKNIMSKFVLGL